MANPLDSFKNLGTGGKIAVVGGGLVAVYLAYRYEKSKSASAASSSTATSPASIDPVTGLPYSEDNTVDPLTGMTYLAEAQEYGSVAAAEQAVSAESSGLADAGYGSEYGYGSGYGYGSTGTGVTTDVPAQAYTTNAQWAAAVQSGLTGIGYSATDVAAALGAYLGSLPETAAQAGIVNTALAEYGPPPAGSYSVILASSTTTTGAGGTTGTGTGGGTTTGQPAGPVTGAPVTTAPTGFRVVSVTGGDNVNLAWDAVKGATGYEIAYGPVSGSQEYKQGVGGGSTTEATVPGVGAGSAGKHYFEIWALPAAAGGPHAGPIEATTTKS